MHRRGSSVELGTGQEISKWLGGECMGRRGRTQHWGVRAGRCKRTWRTTMPSHAGRHGRFLQGGRAARRGIRATPWTGRCGRLPSTTWLKGVYVQGVVYQNLGHGTVSFGVRVFSFLPTPLTVAGCERHRGTACHVYPYWIGIAGVPVGVGFGFGRCQMGA